MENHKTNNSEASKNSLNTGEEVNRNKTTETTDKNIQNVLGSKRERENVESPITLDLKKQKIENHPQVENGTNNYHIHPGSLINHQYAHLPNYNLYNGQVPPPPVYGYYAPQVGYYNQSVIPPHIPASPYGSQRYPFNPTTVYPVGYSYPQSAIPPTNLYHQPQMQSSNINNYLPNYSQSVLNQAQIEKQKYVIKDYPEITVGNYLQSKNLKEEYLSSIKPKDASISVADAVNSASSEIHQKDVLSPSLLINKDQTKGKKIISFFKLVETNILTQEKQQTNPNVNLNNTTNSNNNIILSSKYSQPQINSSINLNINIGTFNQIQKSPVTDSLVNSSQNKFVEINNDNNNNNNNKNHNLNFTPNKNIINRMNNNYNNDNKTTIIKQGLNVENSGSKNTNQTNKDQVANDDFSESLQNYIIRAYEKCKDDIDKKKCKKNLLKIITAATTKGDLHTRDFSKFPLPVLPSEEREDTRKMLEEINKKKGLPPNSSINNPNINNNFFQNKKEKFIPIKNYNNMNINLNNLGNNKNQLNNNFTSLEELTKNTIIIGTCTDLEKQYLRLTSLPDPSQVRPESILKKSLKMLKEKWKNKEAEYNYFDEQFRSIRQDLTIQHIHNDFTVKVYEINARIAMECHDLDQFNQCQTKLINLYESGLKGKETEFLAYRIIYMGLHKIKYDMEYLLKRLRKDRQLKNTCEISHALKTHRVLNDNNYFEFFKLYKLAPNMSSYLIEPFLPRIRIKTLHIIALAYFTEIELSFISDKLAFESVEQCIKFLEDHKLKLNQDRTKLLCKESLSAINGNELMLTKHITSNL